MPGLTQHIVADEARVAGGDYYEMHFGSEKWLPDEEQDRFALDSEAVCKDIFGISAIRSVRGKLIQFKDRHQLSQAEIRRLAMVGVLRPTPSDLRVRAYASEWLMGSFLLCALPLWGGAMGLAIELSEAAAWKKLLAELVVLGVVSGSCWAIHRWFVWPYGRLRKPCERSIAALGSAYTQLLHWAKNRVAGRKKG